MNKEAKQTEESRLSRWVEARLVDLVEKVSTLYYIVIFATAVICFGLFYYLLTQCGHGIGRDDTALDNATIFTGIYFSIVTISSLGYGDMHPMGISKILACIEVLFGLAMIGIMIAKVTSQRLSYRVKRLFSSDAQKRLEDIAAKFDTSRLEVDEILSDYDTPLAEDKDKSTLISRFRKVISDLQSSCIELRDYLSYEIGQQDNYFEVAPANAMMRVGGAVKDTIFILSKRIADLQEQSRDEILDRDNRHRILKAIDSQEKVCNLVNQHVTDQDTLDVFQCIEETCGGDIGRFLAVPEESSSEQPDQTPQDTDEPQDLFSGMDNE